MAQTFSRYAGVIQLVIGVLGQFIPGIGSLLGAQGTGGNVFNMLSGAVLSYLGFKGSASNQLTGAKAIGGLNGLVGLLGFIKPDLLGLDLNQGAIANIINLLIGAWGLYSGFIAKKTLGASA